MGFGAGDDLGGVGEFLRDVETHELAQGLRGRHVRDQAPVRLADRDARVGRDVADVRRQGDLDAGSVGDTVHRGDHRDGEFLPHPRRALGEVRRALVGLVDQARALALARVRHQPGDVEATAECAPLPRQHDRPQAFVQGEVRTGIDEGDEHVEIDRVHLVAAHHLYVGNAIALRDADSLAHGTSGKGTRA